jgi:hypothetical protein
MNLLGVVVLELELELEAEAVVVGVQKSWGEVKEMAPT